IPAIRVGAVIQKPLEWFRLEIFARAEENGEPAPAEAVHVSTGADQEFHFRSLARVRRTHQLFDEERLKLGIGVHKLLDERRIAGADRLLQLTGLFERLHLLLELGPAWEAIPLGDLKLRVCQGGCGAGTDEVLGLITQMSEIRALGK